MESPNARPGTAKLGLWMCTALVVGNMIGSGVFLLPASLAGYGGISVFGWLISAAGASLLALVFSRLSRRVPKAGGPYAYTRRGFGDFAGFLVAWGYWISILATNAAIAVAFVSYLSSFWPALAGNSVLAASVAIGTIWILTLVNARGVRSGGMVQLVTTVLKLVPLVLVATLGLLYFDPDNFLPLNQSGRSSFSAITATVTLTLWAFLGLESATVPAADVRDPERTIPRATIIGTAAASLVYIFGTVAVMGALPPSELAVSTAPYADAGRVMWGGWAGHLVGLGAIVSCFGALNGWILLQGQIPLAAAMDGLFPGPFARVGGRGTPVAGLLISSVLVTILVMTNYTKGLVELFTFAILLATLTCLVPYVFSTMAELILLLREGGRGRGERLWASAAIAILAFLYSLWAIVGSGRDSVYWGFLLLMCGLPVYVWIRRRQPE